MPVNFESYFFEHVFPLLFFHLVVAIKTTFVCHSTTCQLKTFAFQRITYNRRNLRHRFGVKRIPSVPSPLTFNHDSSRWCSLLLFLTCVLLCRFYCHSSIFSCSVRLRKMQICVHFVAKGSKNDNFWALRPIYWLRKRSRLRSLSAAAVRCSVTAAQRLGRSKIVNIF